MAAHDRRTLSSDRLVAAGQLHALEAWPASPYLQQLRHQLHRLRATGLVAEVDPDRAGVPQQGLDAGPAGRVPRTSERHVAGRRRDGLPSTGAAITVMPWGQPIGEPGHGLAAGRAHDDPDQTRVGAERALSASTRPT